MRNTNEIMTQDERWLAKYNEVVEFIETSHRNPSKYYDGEKLSIHFFLKRQKALNAGGGDLRIQG